MKNKWHPIIHLHQNHEENTNGRQHHSDLVCESDETADYLVLLISLISYKIAMLLSITFTVRTLKIIYMYMYTYIYTYVKFWVNHFGL